MRSTWWVFCGSSFWGIFVSLLVRARVVTFPQILAPVHNGRAAHRLSDDLNLNVSELCIVDSRLKMWITRRFTLPCRSTIQM